MLKLGYAEVDITPYSPIETIGFNRGNNISQAMDFSRYKCVGQSVEARCYAGGQCFAKISLVYVIGLVDILGENAYNIIENRRVLLHQG